MIKSAMALADSYRLIDPSSWVTPRRGIVAMVIA